MTIKHFNSEHFGSVKVTKRRGSKSIRLSINADGEVRITQPTWLPYTAGLTFLSQKKDWVLKERQAKLTTIEPGQLVGKSHTVYFKALREAQACRSRVAAGSI